MTAKRFEINNNMNLDNKIETYELSCLVDNENKTFYFVVDSIANVESFVERLNELHEENERLKEYNNKLMKQPLLFDVQTIPDTMEIMEANSKLEKENEQLQERNDRQAKQLDRLYQLISEKDWRTLTDIIDDFKKAEEELQRESGTYW